MSANTVKWLVYALMTIGVLLVLLGVAMITFSGTYMDDRGVDGVLLVTGLITAGLFLLIPSKIFLLFTFMKLQDKRKKTL